MDDAVTILSRETEGIEYIGAAADIFLPESLQGKDRASIIASRDDFDVLFAESFSPDGEYSGSAFFKLIERHQPDVIVDCINTATAISYQDVFTVSRRTKMLLDSLEEREGAVDAAELQPLIHSVRELLVAQGVPQITRHIMFLQRALEESAVSVYVKVGTTGTGGMGINIPYTHSEDKPSPQLLAKSAIGFAHTGLLFLLARTPSGERHGAIIKELVEETGAQNAGGVGVAAMAAYGDGVVYGSVIGAVLQYIPGSGDCEPLPAPCQEYVTAPDAVSVPTFPEQNIVFPEIVSTGACAIVYDDIAVALQLFNTCW